MSAAGESGRAQQIRAKAQDLEQAAERATDPQERQRLKDKARHLKEQSERQRYGPNRTSIRCSPGSSEHRPPAEDRPPWLFGHARGPRPVTAVSAQEQRLRR